MWSDSGLAITYDADCRTILRQYAVGEGPDVVEMEEDDKEARSLMAKCEKHDRQESLDELEAHKNQVGHYSLFLVAWLNAKRPGTESKVSAVHHHSTRP